MPLFVVEVLTGPSAGRRIEILPGVPVSLGRTPRAQIVISDDAHLSGVHFSLESKGQGCILRDLKSTNGTWVNGAKIEEVLLADGGTFGAGDSTFRVLFQGDSGEPDWSEFSPDQKAFLTLLYAPDEPAFAVLDAAQEDRIPAFLDGCETEYASLYDGEEAESLKMVAPYLVALPKTSKLVPLFMSAGWGNNWGIFLSSRSSTDEIRNHLRQFLLVETEERKPAFFRFYDPRVLRAYLPTRTTEQRVRFFGPITRFVVEGDDPSAPLSFVPVPPPSAETGPAPIQR